MAVAHMRDDTPGGRRLAFECPGCCMMHEVRVDGPGPGPLWQWDGSLDAPIISPSILVAWTYGEPPRKRVCHSFVRAGRIEFLGDCTHELAGQTVPLPEDD